MHYIHAIECLLRGRGRFLNYGGGGGGGGRRGGGLLATCCIYIALQSQDLISIFEPQSLASKQFGV